LETNIENFLIVKNIILREVNFRRVEPRRLWNGLSLGIKNFDAFEGQKGIG